MAETSHLVVIGSGPGGYAAAFRAADLGLKVTLIERYPTLGGVCLNVGCIPSKALLHIAAVIREAGTLKDSGVVFQSPEIIPSQLMNFKEETISRLNDGLAKLARQRNVNIVQGTARFDSEHHLQITETQQSIQFDNAIIATGSRNHRLAGLPSDERIVYSTAALNIKQIPQRLLVVGGGVIGIETAFIYQGLGTQVTIIEVKERLFDTCDTDIIKPLQTRLEQVCNAIYLSAELQSIKAEDTLTTEIKTDNGTITSEFDMALISAGRIANSNDLGLESISIICDAHGFIQTDECLRTNLAHIYAVGDVTGAPMLAHKATYQGKIAAENIKGLRTRFDAKAIPSVIYSDPEIAWAGLTEQQAQSTDVAYQQATFPWQASGRALSTKQEYGLTKLIYSPDSKRLLGAAICGANAGELISELVLAIEMRADIHDIALTIHPHPTYAETVGQASELALATIVELYTGRNAKE